MSGSKVRVPVKGGLATARQKLKELRNKKSPSPELVKIIDEVTHQTPEGKNTENKKISLRLKKLRPRNARFHTLSLDTDF